MTGNTSMALTTRSFLLRLAVAAIVILVFALLSRAGGPEYVAGVGYFSPGISGQPVLWSQGSVTYFTDQGDLSPILPSAGADALVLDAWSRWTAVPTAAIATTYGGHLAEDISGANVIRNADGTISMPLDIQPGATTTPVGIVYDSDGSVTDALLGTGAGGASQCFANAAFGGIDNFSTTATLQHALVIINGQCALQSAQLTDLEYRLVRVFGRVLGLGWSQVNLNVINGNPRPTSDDFSGFPVMHYSDPLNCTPITFCYPTPYQLSMDDQAALSRLYPITSQNRARFPGKQLFSSTTARIHGSVWFANSQGNATQAMQGVNVVARWLDPLSGLPSRRYVASSVSGFSFAGNVGNPITGFLDALGNPLNQWGSTDLNLEGFFDLSGLQLPGGATSGKYQITIEPLDSLWSSGVEPYGPSQVTPSGTVQPITVNVSPGIDVAKDIVMTRSAQPLGQWANSETWSSPAIIPPSGDWAGSISGYGAVPYFSMPARADRTLSVSVTALDENGSPTLQKAQPLIGMWPTADPPGTPPPAYTSSSFNSAIFGETRLDAQIFASTDFRIGIADFRGDGRPDYRYHAHVLYGDSVSPPRIGSRGGILTVNGMGFAPGLTATVGSGTAPILSASAGRLILAAPALGDELKSVTITDTATGASTTLTDAFTSGAAADDKLVLLQGSNSATPVGIQAPNPVIVRAVAADGVAPVNGATIGWSTTNGAALSSCGGAATCSVATDEGGLATTWVTPAAPGVATITATLAPGVYFPAISVSATLLGTSSANDLGISTPNLWIAQGASVSIPLQARVLANGEPRSGATVNFTSIAGGGTLSSSSSVTDANGYAAVTVTITQISANIRVNACLAPNNSPCQSFFGTVVPPAQQTLQLVSGSDQAVSSGQAFQPVTVRVVDNATPPNPVIGATVTFQTLVMRPPADSPTSGSGETKTGNPAEPVILATSQTAVQTDANGLASIIPTTGSFAAPVQLDVMATGGTSSAFQFQLKAFPVVAGSPGQNSPRVLVNPLPARLRISSEER